jgi:hypothetical protein
VHRQHVWVPPDVVAGRQAGLDRSLISCKRSHDTLNAVFRVLHTIFARARITRVFLLHRFLLHRPAAKRTRVAHRYASVRAPGSRQRYTEKTPTPSEPHERGTFIQHTIIDNGNDFFLRSIE